MENIIKEQEIDEIVKNVLSDYHGGKNIDELNIFNKPDKAEVRELIRNLFRIIFPGYFRERTFKIYNLKKHCRDDRGHLLSLKQAGDAGA